MSRSRIRIFLVVAVACTVIDGGDDIPGMGCMQRDRLQATRPPSGDATAFRRRTAAKARACKAGGGVPKGKRSPGGFNSCPFDIEHMVIPTRTPR